MPVAVFFNGEPRPLTLIIEPNDERYEVPHLAKLGVRYTSESGTADRTFADIGEHAIRFWCDSPTREVEIVFPTEFERLLWDICVNGGFCGGIVKGQPTRVTDLLPTTGTVTAGEFATLAIRAECDEQSPPDQHRRWKAQLEAQFLKHLGSESVPAEALTLNLANPFD